MLTDFTWKTFERTGSIESYIFFKELTNHKNRGKEKHRMPFREVAVSMGKEL